MICYSQPPQRVFGLGVEGGSGGLWSVAGPMMLADDNLNITKLAIYRSCGISKRRHFRVHPSDRGTRSPLNYVKVFHLTHPADLLKSNVNAWKTRYSGFDFIMNDAPA